MHLKYLIIIFFLAQCLGAQDYPFQVKENKSLLVVNNKMVKRIGLGPDIGILGGNSVQDVSFLGHLGSNFILRFKYGKFYLHQDNDDMKFSSAGIQVGENIILNLFQYYLAFDYGRISKLNKNDTFWITKFGANFFTQSRYMFSIEAGLFSGIEWQGQNWMKNGIQINFSTHIFIW